MDIPVGPFLSDLIAGLVGAAILGGLALLFRHAGSERSQVWANKLRRMVWPLLTFVFLATALMSAILQPPPRSIVVALGTVVVLVLASFILLRFGPARIRRLWATIRTYAWSILTGLFFMSTVTLLVIGVVSPPIKSGERIVFVVDVADEEWIVLRDILDGLEPKLEAEVFLMSVDSKYTVSRLHKMEASGDMRWDLMAVDNNMLGMLGGRGLVEELPDEAVPPNLLTSLLPLVEYEDKICFVPFRPNVKIAFYNKQKFDLYGLEPPKTRDELLEVARVFYEKEEVGRVAIQGSPGPATAVTVFEFVKAAGGNPLTLDDDESWDTFVFLQELKEYLAPEYAETKFDTANELLISDVVYLVSNWTYGIKVVIVEAGKTEIQAYSGWEGPPGGHGEVHVLGGDVLAIPKGAHHKETAIELIKLLLEIETQQELLFRLFWPPAIIDAYVIPPDKEPPYFQYVQKALGFAVLRSTSPQWTMVESVLDGAFGELVREDKDISILDEYRDMLKEIPSEYSPYTVEPGDTLDVIARRHDIPVDFLAKANGITPQTVVCPGQTLLVPKQ